MLLVKEGKNIIYPNRLKFLQKNQYFSRNSKIDKLWLCTQILMILNKRKNTIQIKINKDQIRNIYRNNIKVIKKWYYSCSSSSNNNNLMKNKRKILTILPQIIKVTFTKNKMCLHYLVNKICKTKINKHLLLLMVCKSLIV
jgi:hypothetical protein